MSSANINPARLHAAHEKAVAALLAEGNARGFWEGELSSSALSTATAVSALAVALKHDSFAKLETRIPEPEIDSGLRWLSANQNVDGGWGDTTKSLSNLSTTTLCWAAFGAAKADLKFVSCVNRAEAWLRQHAESIAPDRLAPAIIARYGRDRTFSVPILTMCALAGRLGSGREAWRHVIPLPFELAAFPHQFFAALRLPVVSYALPALIAIGQARHFHAPARNPFPRLLRHLTRKKTLRALTSIQPSNGGFLEATPLTSFVTMSLAASGQAQHVVTRRGLEFLLQSQRLDGSWPIDTNLATWCTTLALDALPQSSIPNPQSSISWLLAQQYQAEHPYTHAAPGGWAWTNLPGGVPDADDTSGALVALAKLTNPQDRTHHVEVQRAAESGIRWLLALQNRDGGIPTFCRGWGALPFDRSSADITAHAIRAWLAWRNRVSVTVRKTIEVALPRALEFLARAQTSAGAWSPLWFGNQFSPTDENLTYGTARVVRVLGEVRKTFPFDERALVSGIQWLLGAQRQDGSWGGFPSGPSSIEETALATEALAAAALSIPERRAEMKQAALRGAAWLVEQVDSDGWLDPSPIGFYFAKLWYFERLYPQIFTVGALHLARELADE